MEKISFQDVTPRLGTIFRGESYGAAWGDFNGDGWTDLWSPNHHDPGNLFINTRNGRFRERATNILQTPKNVDPHGSAWADFDNDGDQDLAQSIGGAFGREAAKINPIYFNQLFVNQNNKLKDSAIPLGVSDPGGRGRSPLWFDYDNDGKLDLILTNGVKDLEDVETGDQPPTQLFRQTRNRFQNVTDQSGFNFEHSRYGTLSDLNNDGSLDLIFSSIGKVFDIREFPFRDITSTLFTDGKIPRHRDVAIADFNGDLKPDLFLAKEDLRSDYIQSSPTEARVLFRQARGVEHGASFQTETPGTVTIRLRSPQYLFALEQEEIFIGSDGLQPERIKQFENFIELTLNANDANVHGIAPHESGDQNGLYIGFNPNLNTWEIYWSPGLDDTPVVHPIALISSETELSELTPINFTATRDTKTNKNLLLLNQGDGQPFRKQTVGGLVAGSASSVVAADFDNDRDVDAYVVNTGSIANLPNTYFENQGNGRFRVRNDLGALDGTQLGVGESVVASDYDRDGFIDLYITNGRNILGPWFHDDNSPPQLLKNKGNSNHWVQLDLVGTVSNRDAIGSSVLLTSGGITQLREQNNGSHTFAQNDRRIHFGLGQHTNVQKIQVNWRSGIRQTMTNFGIDRLHTIIEGRGRSQSDLIIGSQKKDRLFGLGGNDELFGEQKNDEIFGGSGNDRLQGGGGNDTLTGQRDNDVLVGGRGSDTFILDSPIGVDTIRDFSLTDDHLQIASKLISKAFSPGSVPSNAFRLGSQSKFASDRFLYDRLTGTLRFDTDGLGGEQAVVLGIFANKPALRATHLEII